MKKSDIIVTVGVVLLIVAAVLYFLRPQPAPELPELPPASQLQPPVEQPPQPAVRYPITPPTPVEPPSPGAAAPEPAAPSQPSTEATVPAQPQPNPEPLPALENSDAPLASALEAVLSTRSYEPLFYTDSLIRRLVVSVDNLPGSQFPRSNYWVARPTPGQLVVERENAGQQEERLYLSPENYARYRRFVAVVEGLDAAGLVAIYRRFYPLFQAVYENLGYPPSAYFNDRLVDVIDQLLKTPEVTGPIELLRPHVLYQYADPQLEQLSAGQKVLIRVGPQNARTLKAKLREIRRALVDAPAGRQPQPA
jgi:hypothetical protein